MITIQTKIISISLLFSELKEILDKSSLIDIRYSNPNL